jgi:hypothetical protein
MTKQRKRYLVTKRLHGSTKVCQDSTTENWKFTVMLMAINDGVIKDDLPKTSDITEFQGAHVDGERFTYWIHLLP